MEKKDLLGVRKKLPAAAAKRRRKVVSPAKAGSAGWLAKVIAAYLASDSYMYAPLVSAPPAHPPPPPAAAVAPSAAPPISTPERSHTGAKIQSLFASYIHCLLEVFVDMFLELFGAVCF
ncbi:uncharacterized protein [Miscanthus floridulus]|uniref:uncharacterized protein n=1 Tax=Miscanthus floridulus TaxID=154761 RepID=UPI00345A51BA